MAELEHNVKEAVLELLVKVSNDIWMVVRFLEKLDFTRGDGDAVLNKAFDGDCTPLERSFVNNGSLRSTA